MGCRAALGDRLPSLSFDSAHPGRSLAGEASQLTTEDGDHTGEGSLESAGVMVVEVVSFRATALGARDCAAHGGRPGGASGCRWVPPQAEPFTAQLAGVTLRRGPPSAKRVWSARKSVSLRKRCDHRRRLRSALTVPLRAVPASGGCALGAPTAGMEACVVAEAVIAVR
jgi:hypothetical protein